MMNRLEALKLDWSMMTTSMATLNWSDQEKAAFIRQMLIDILDLCEQSPLEAAVMAAIEGFDTYDKT